MLENLWQFTYHRGPAPLTAVVRASSEDLAMAVATKWCRSKGYRPQSSVRPMIVADESILDPVKETPVAAAEIPTAVQATTAVFAQRTR